MEVKLISWTKDPIGTCAKAASMCYNSEPSRKIVRGCIKSGHCYDENTEVLTEDGFVKWSNVTYDTKIANVNPKTREFVGFEKPLALVAYEYDGELIKFENKYVDLMITPEHKIYCSLSNTVKKRLNPEFELIEANKVIKTSNQTSDKPVYEKPLRMTTCATNVNSEKGNPIYKLYGFFIGDGFCSTDKSVIRFRIKKERKVRFLKKVCEECNLVLREMPYDKYAVEIKGFRSMFYNETKDKTFPNEFLKMSRENFNNFFEGLINSDGSIDSNSIRYTTSSKELMDKISALFSINNIIFTVSHKKNNERCENWKDTYTFNISTSNKNPMFNDSRSKKYAEKVHYKGMVYCAETNTGLIIVRRNNKVSLCGNCSIIEHANYTFKITGVSRSLLAQLTRHRHASYSVESQRYCKYESLEFVVPDCDKVGWVQNVGKYIIDAYKDMLDDGWKPEDARSVLPNATPTNLVVTMNLRGLMNFMNERLCTRSQKEIRTMAAFMRNATISCPDHTDEDKEIVKSILVPKCERYEIPFCPEYQSCGKHQKLTELVKG